jgi:DNA recombination protein RmuC
MLQYAVGALVVLSVAALAGIALLWMRRDALAERAAAQAADTLGRNLADRLSAATADIAARLERTRGDIRQDLTDRMQAGFRDLKESLEQQLSSGRQEQAQTLAREMEGLGNATRASLEAIRAEVDQKLATIGEQVQQKLDKNIQEGFQQFQQVQQHLKAAEEQLRNVGTIGASINDLNALLKMPHLRGKFGEASLERLLEDFLPAHMYQLQASASRNGPGRADAVIKFPGRNLPIDAKFPREQVLPLFESNDPAALARARENFARVMKEQGKRIAAYIEPENGTTDMALMYLPSETLYMEAVLNAELSEWLNKQRIFLVSPNTLIVTLQSIAMVFKMYEFAKSYEKATEELGKAQKSFAYFEDNFDKVGKSLDKAQEAFGVAKTHLGRYRNRVIDLSGEPVPEIEDAEQRKPG